MKMRNLGTDTRVEDKFHDFTNPSFSKNLGFE